jgi:cyclopropane-fatty-acyl-phospholipid synthase
VATQRDIEAFYDGIGYFHVLRMGKYVDYTAAFFDGDFTKSLDEAQEAKHEWVLHGLRFRPGHRILDIGCGWGPMLQSVKARGGTAVGLTLSRDQVAYCRARGWDARLLDYKAADPRTLGKFDGICCIGAFEHFCSPEEYAAGNQNEIYRQFFSFCAALLSEGGRLYLQCGIFGRRVLDPTALTPDAPQGSDEAICFRLSKIYPGAWLAADKQQILSCASEYFTLLYSVNGRADYIETLNRWGLATKNLFRRRNVWRTIAKVVSLIPRYLTESDFRIQVSSVYHNDQQVCFQREIMDHERMFFETKQSGK